MSPHCVDLTMWSKITDTSNQVPEALYRKAEAYLALGMVINRTGHIEVAKYNYPNSVWTERLSDLRKNPENLAAPV